MSLVVFFLGGVGFWFIIEGLMMVLAPGFLRRYIADLMAQSDATLTVMGAGVLIAGALALWFATRLM